MPVVPSNFLRIQITKINNQQSVEVVTTVWRAIELYVLAKMLISSIIHICIEKCCWSRINYMLTEQKINLESFLLGELILVASNSQAVAATLISYFPNNFLLGF